MFLVGPNTYFPLNAFSKKQTVVANSSTEAEVVSANHALRAEGIPMLALLEQLGIFKKLSQKAAVKPKPNTPEPEDPVFTRIDKEIGEIRYMAMLRGAFLRQTSMDWKPIFWSSIKWSSIKWSSWKITKLQLWSCTRKLFDDEVFQKDPKYWFQVDEATVRGGTIWPH